MLSDPRPSHLASVCWGDALFDEGALSPPTTGEYLMLTAGDFHACALGDDGAVVCWGRDDDGQASPPAGRYT